jgi:hypothetical protein
MFKTIKKQIRIVAWDDGPFKFDMEECILVGVIFRGGEFLDGVLRTTIRVDGLDATEKIAEAIKRSKFKDLRVIMLDGITFGGFNMVDIKELFSETNLPIIVVNRKKPNIEKFIKALKKFNDFEKRYRIFKNAGKIYSLNVKSHFREGKIYFQFFGLEREDAEKIINITIKNSIIPEPLRVAHLIATGIVLGESIGRA